MRLWLRLVILAAAAALTSSSTVLAQGAYPVELAAFSDAGVAWGRTSSFQFSDGDHTPVSSVGAAARINLLGFAVAEIDYVRPLDRPGRGWLWQFNLRPGF